MRASPPLTHPTQHLPDSRFPIPDSRFPNQNKKNSVKFWLIPILDRIISCNSQNP
ncbi:hypothetical protein [Moorena sp. SIO4G3]|uniref:hypothetical protein n=1 Tax=Moorena sp. SIO4G3 TaxID=2607821 RepID=UPI00142A0226|nr:hypothetical protein [Moorena sp. SIO4G3]NEO79529.1 hypothetical protein [Moorena sp. SIO4G3]